MTIEGCPLRRVLFDGGLSVGQSARMFDRGSTFRISVLAGVSGPALGCAWRHLVVCGLVGCGLVTCGASPATDSVCSSYSAPGLCSSYSAPGMSSSAAACVPCAVCTETYAALCAQCSGVCTVQRCVHSAAECVQCSCLCSMQRSVYSAAMCAQCSGVCTVQLSVQYAAECVQCSDVCTVQRSVYSAAVCAVCSGVCSGVCSDLQYAAGCAAHPEVAAEARARGGGGEARARNVGPSRGVRLTCLRETVTPTRAAAIALCGVGGFLLHACSLG